MGAGLCRRTRRYTHHATGSNTLKIKKLFSSIGNASDGAPDATILELPATLVKDPLLGTLTNTIGVGAVLLIMGLVIGAIMTTKRLQGSSLFNRLFIVVAVAAGGFSAVSSAIGFSLITSQESADFFRNSILPPAFGVFVFFLAVAIWVGGAEFVRHRDWFRGLSDSPVGDAAFFVERMIKLLVVIPFLAAILFFVSTWTTVVGIGGADAVRHTYQFEISRLQTECAGITAYRQKDFLLLEDLRLSVGDTTRVAEAERTTGAQSGAAGAGAVTDYFNGLAAWYRGLEMSVATMLDAAHPSGADPFAPESCAVRIDSLQKKLSENAFENYDRWAREFETEFNDFTSILNRWRKDDRVATLLDQQRTGFERANPKPNPSRLNRSQVDAIDQYSADIDTALKKLLSKHKRAKPPVPLKSAAELSPARGLKIFAEFLSPPPPPEEVKKVSRTAAVVATEFVPGLSTITPRDAVLKNANIFSDIWALAISWDYAPYLLMFAFLFFPSAERAAGFKD